jgi:hypothetical protein
MPSRKLLAVLVLGLAVVPPAAPTLAKAVRHAPDDPGLAQAPAVDGARGYPFVDSAASDPRGPDPRGPLPAMPSRLPEGIAVQLADWVAAVRDNGALPFLIVDKPGARVFAFDPEGGFLGSAPALLGLATGDDSAPGIGDLKLSQIDADQRTTPAGRFVAHFGPAAGHGTMLWVDYQDGISLHPVMSVNAGEHRQKRIRSSDPAEHRISYGCINVPATFYDSVVLPALGGGDAVVYVLPDTKPIAEVFPAFAAANGDVGDGGPRLADRDRDDGRALRGAEQSDDPRDHPPAYHAKPVTNGAPALAAANGEVDASYPEGDELRDDREPRGGEQPQDLTDGLSPPPPDEPIRVGRPGER